MKRTGCNRCPGFANARVVQRVGIEDFKHRRAFGCLQREPHPAVAYFPPNLKAKLDGHSLIGPEVGRWLIIVIQEADTQKPKVRDAGIRHSAGPLRFSTEFSVTSR